VRRAHERGVDLTRRLEVVGVAAVAATTTAIGSPTWRTRSVASAYHGGSANADPSRLRMPPPRSAINVGIAPTPPSARSRPVNTPSTPATASAGVPSIATTSAWACGERTNAA